MAILTDLGVLLLAPIGKRHTPVKGTIKFPQIWAAFAKIGQLLIAASGHIGFKLCLPKLSHIVMNQKILKKDPRI